MDKHEISIILKDIGTLLEIKGESFFKSKAYYDAARNIELIDGDLEAIVNSGELKEIRGFGDALTQKITELLKKGRLEYYEKLKESIPAGLMEMLKIPGLGAKKIKVIYEKLNIETIGELKYACLENRLAKLSGFGEKTQAKILEGIENLGKYAGKYHFHFAARLAEELKKSFLESGLVIRCSEGGSLRRKKEVVKDIDLLVSSTANTEVMDFFTSHPLVLKVVSKGETKSSAVLKDGINADLRVVSDDEFPYALHHFTGSKEHNTALRHIAKQQGIKMNEYGLFKDEELIKCKDEEDIFKVFGMSYIPPELRENNGELEEALEGGIPELVTVGDLRGIIHVHSNYSDGSNSIEELVLYCKEKGYSYMGISDHSQTAYYAGGLTVDDIKRQHEEIDRLNEKHGDFTILKGIELDILPDGSLDYNDDILSWFDFTIASVHSSFRLEEKAMTERVVRAMQNKYVKILGHPTGRLLLSREPYKINMDAIIETASIKNVAIEINANPHRLDLDWRYVKAAKEAGCKFAVCPDAHDLKGIDNAVFGINIARKGWLVKSDVINTSDTSAVRSMLNGKIYSNL